MYGWAGCILRVDLSKGSITKQSLNKELALQFIGGRGINSKMLFDENKAGIDAFDPQNNLLFGTGPLTGTIGPSFSRFNVTTKSPLGYLGDSNSGGFWAPELKFAGYDHIVVTGCSDRPVYLWIRDDEVELREASHLWGMDTWEAPKQIRKELADENVQIACIGPAGEKLVRFACVRTGLKRAAGRMGTGAVMGSKRLKAIAVRGTKSVEIAYPEKFLRAVKKARKILKPVKYVKGALSTCGGTYGTLWFSHNEWGKLVTKHHQSGHWKEAATLDPKFFFDKYVTKMVGCFSCPVLCTPYYKVDDGKFKGMYGEGPEFESFASLGAATLVKDLQMVLKASERTCKLGLDCGSTGRVIAYAMELFQRGIIDEKDVGFSLKWGDGEAMLRLLEMIVKREGIGNVLAEGEARASKILGKEAEKFAVVVKNVELHEPLRAMVGHSLAHATSTRGPDHLRGSYHAEHGQLTPEEAESRFGYRTVSDPLSYEHKVPPVLYYENVAALADMLEICKSLTSWAVLDGLLGENILAELFSFGTGVEMNSRQLLLAAERVYNVERAFIVREGVRRKDDYPPQRDFEMPQASGRFKGAVLDKGKYDTMLDEYYALHGWDKNGIPTEQKLKELGLGDVATVLHHGY